MMRKSLCAGVAVLALSCASALAADLPIEPEFKAPVTAPPPPLNWTGFYWGVHAGGGWGDAEHHSNLDGTFSDHSVSGALLGGQIGYNWQVDPSWVFGIEADLAWSNIDGDDAFGFTELDWLSTVRARLGVTWDATMIYATGGFAFGRVEAGDFVDSGRETRTGWAAGAGIESFLAPNWTAKLEYLFVDLRDKNTYVGGVGALVDDVSVDFHAHTIRVGLNYKF